MIIYSDDKRGEKVMTFNFLRNQERKEKDVPNLSLADFILPADKPGTDYMGAFVVTAEPDEEKMKEFRDDDYATIMIRILSDRIAEAFTELIHEKVRREIWGYSPEEKITVDNMLKLKYSGIRPAPGYPACPDHTEKEKLFELLDVENNIGVTLTSSYAMVPVSSVSGYLFSNRESAYFNVGKIGEDQLQDYAKRKGMTRDEAALWLAPNL